MEEINVKKETKRKRHRVKNKGKSIDQSEMEKRPEKSKEQILAERQAKKAAKKQNKVSNEQSPATPSPKTNPESAGEIKSTPTSENKSTPPKPASPTKVPSPKTPIVKEKMHAETPEKSREQILAEREAKKLAKQSAKKKGSEGNQKTESPQQQQQQQLPKRNEQSEQKREIVKTNSDVELAVKMENLHISEGSDVKTPPTPQTQEKAKPSKAERRAIQEAQRAAKAKSQEKVTVTPKIPAKSEAKIKEVKTPHHHHHHHNKTPSSNVHKVKQFKHLYTEKCNLDINANSRLHPAILKLGVQYANDTIVGSNARCYAFLNALQTLVNDFETPEGKVFSRALESEIQMAVEFLQKCRPLAVSMTNALKHIKLLISQETPTDSDAVIKQRIMSKIETYAHEQIETAAIAISLKVREKICNDDVILTFGCSSLIKRSLVEAWKEGEKRFSVIVVDARPDYEGQEMLKSLTMEGISCTYVLINAISFIMPKVTKVLLGAHALLANGYVMSRVGTAQISMVANYFNVPVLICCETHKFSERVQTDSFVYNELGDPNALTKNKNSKTSFEYLKDWESIPHLTPLNLRYDITPPELITAVVTEVALLPCTSVQVILRVKPAE